MAASVLVLSGCSLQQHDPEVTFYANGKTIRIEPTIYCDVEGANCAEKNAPGTLKVPAGKVVQISVDGQLASGLWEVVCVYENAARVQEGCTSPLLGKGDDYTYTLAVPDDSDQLLRIEVHEAAGAVLETGQPLMRGSWVVDVTR
ncbi:DUF2771 family protein [Lentzea sp. BCCO 10_0798]|jgi:hypothetical protein|uniref:DUF2771 family protein n=1 Tax=Lentzea kristufekii TaxID=3095430 RepID=A0ABU4TSW5_9PSEU|nr:DUF2771 family protein [Lentzea sp. BCCO 10_0798]MDX8051178.1 DUF2771 family protein [Lentzea sp. BCCO 10_0798]